MRKSLFIFNFIFCVLNINSTISFSRQDAKFRLNNNAKLNIGSTISNWTGTLEKRDNSNIVGSNINFSEGIFLTQTNEGLLTGLYNVSGADSIELNGNGRFDAQPGTVINQLKISGQNNRLEGQPLFNSTIDFFDSSTSLTVALQSKLNQSLNLNGGTLLLEDDLHLADDTYLLGTGTVILNKQSLDLPGKESTWSSILNFEDAQEIKLNGKTILNNKWSFNGNTILNGNGNILDLSGGGQLELKNNATLALTDLYLKGVDSSSFVFLNDNNTVYMSNVDVELDGDITMNQGGIYVEGTTTFLLKTHDWTFDNSATLTIDGTTLWLDTRIVSPGELKVNKPIFVDHVWQPGNDIDGMTHHHFSVLNTGTVRETCCGANGSSPSPTPETCPCAFLYDAPLTADVDLECSCLIHPTKTIRINDNLTINGHGATLYFCDPTQPQFVVAAGKTVTLKNIQFARLHANTFDLRAYRDNINKIVVDGKISIDENVEFDLSENLTFSQGRINLVNATPLISNVFYTRGLAGKKTFEVSPDTNMYANFGSVVTNKNLINTGQNTIAFQEIELKGLDYIKTEVGINYIGAIGLVGGAVVSVGNPNVTLPPDEKEPCDKVFVIQGLDNIFSLLKNNIYFTGSMSFADIGDNAIHFDFVLRERVGNGVVGGIPKVNFATDFVQLTSYLGHARMYFDDAQVMLNNYENAFLVYENSFLDVNRLLVSGDPIWDLYEVSSGGTPFVIEGDSLEAQDMPSPVVSQYNTMYKRDSFERKTKKYKTALDLIYEKEIEKYFEKYKKETKYETLPLREIIIPPGAESYFSDVLNVVRIENRNQDLGNASGLYLMQNASISNFSVNQDPFRPLQILMASNSTINQDLTQTVTLKQTDNIIVAGDNNKIIVNNDLTLLGNIIIYEDSELTFEFDDSLFKDLTLSFSGLSIFEILQGSRLIFKGKGTVVFSNGFKIHLSDSTLSPRKKSTIAFQESCEVRVEENGLLRIWGDANFVVDSGSRIIVKEGEHIIIGDSINDDFNIVFDRSGVLELGTRIPCGNTTYNFIKALFSIQKTAVSLDFEQGAELSIRGDGIFEINALEGVEKRGYLKNFYFDNDGLLAIENQGRMRIGRNRGDGNQFEWLIDWDNWNGQIVSECEAMVEYVTSGNDIGFAGRLQKNYFVADDLKSAELVGRLINLVPTLSVSVVFYDESGNKKLRLKNGLIVSLNANDTIYADDSVTGYVYGMNRGNQFMIDLDGNRF
ncbi:hypothetical protein KJ644_03595 [Candidatus Dependentiae bacterium]|nr:hypothetical protein [Candidatus Dependentiae bacterium]